MSGIDKAFLGTPALRDAHFGSRTPAPAAASGLKALVVPPLRRFRGEFLR